MLRTLRKLPKRACAVLIGSVFEVLSLVLGSYCWDIAQLSVLRIKLLISDWYVKKEGSVLI